MKLLLVIKKEKDGLEKQVNKLNNNVLLRNSTTFIMLLLLGSIFQVNAQDTTPYERGSQYILGNVEVTGKLTFNQQTVITFAGLEKGQKIIVPGEEISSAIKKLGKLGLFSDIDVYINEIRGDSIFLELSLVELPKLSEAKIIGLKKKKNEELLKELALTKGKVVNENLITTSKNFIEKKYQKDGFYNTKVAANIIPDTTNGNLVKMVINVDKGSKVKISNIDIEGNQTLSDKNIKSAMKKTKEKLFVRFWKGSKFIPQDYSQDLISIVDKYKSIGYRDARIVYDSVQYKKEDNTIAIKMKIEEGRKYYFGDIKFLGNTIYTDQGLNRLLGIKKGDTYNGVLLQDRIANKKSPDADDITNLYQNNGYLFSTINPVEVRTVNDTIDFEIRIMEGPLAYFNKITVVGNDKTNDHVIYRELRTKPGQIYSKESLIRTIREIGQLGFFDPEAIDPKFKNVDAAAGTVDIEYNLVEKGSSQIELQGGYGGGGFIGTLGLSFNNFSVRNIFNKDAYKPLPMGDGQRMSLRLQGSTFFQTYSLSFSEPWFGGRKPMQFSTSISHSKQFLNNFQSNRVDKSRSFNITSLAVGTAKRLQVPDDFFTLSQGVSFQYYQLNNYTTNLFTFPNGTSRNLSYFISLSRNNKGVNPIFPVYGSEFSVTAKFSPPYSLFNNIDYKDLPNQEEYKVKTTTVVQNPTTGDNMPIGTYLDETGNPVENYQDAAVDIGKVDQKSFYWLEFYKIKLKGDWYTKLAGNNQNALVLRTLGEFGYLGAYNQDRGVIPFERFFLGGDGLANITLDGRDVIQLRGYPNFSLSGQDGGVVYNKFSMELRYPLTLKSAASIYVLGFAEAGASYNSLKEYNPFVMQRSAGFGLRVFMPAFGLLGIDFGYGFDAIPGLTQKNGWETHFIIGQQF
ncbi:POTRA domain-containing protein [Flavobacterium sp.]|uniref:BamA/OMP85 family outer membrane protein n=1 Tax=Flavobacterium sp. TaxID=239 RepID=UPI00262EAC5C|nr:POTRA domain-containing protein [Flavobacterium sp.]MDD2985122.1 POTRA domain-containing protein [Flavobacterium sp.]